MDVDAPNILKRCNSAPLINETSSTAATSPTTSTAPRNTSFFSMFSNNNVPRTRRFSASSSLPPVNPGMPRLTPRVTQLRAEECADVCNTREVAHEREVHCAMQMGQSYDDLTIEAPSPTTPHSPTRIPRFSPVVSPSPTRKYTTRRSLSPITIRASCLSPVLAGGKRRCEEPLSAAKRACPEPLAPPAAAPPTPPTPPTPPPPDCTFRPLHPACKISDPS